MFINLTDAQIELILKNHPFYASLISGERCPETDAQHQFLEVVRGERPATTPHEIAYQAWKQSGVSLSILKKEAVKRKKRENSINVSPGIGSSPRRRPSKLSELARKDRQVSLADISSQKPSSDREGSVNRDLIPGAGLATKPKNYARKIDEPWGSREDFKRDRASWKRSSK